ncbi:MAG TPA: hypothetical protein DCM08_05180, partial [Microscillaceae bacterium]|nr:hypothetical protein [Microscillaceae bacterium]
FIEILAKTGFVNIFDCTQPKQIPKQEVVNWILKYYFCFNILKSNINKHKSNEITVFYRRSPTL